MCLDIDPDSVIHKHLRNKLNNLYKDTGDSLGYNTVLQCWSDYGDRAARSKHNLTMLPSFHISLGAPKKEINSEFINSRFCHRDMVPILGDITLAPIGISKKDNKLSAWIPLNVHWIVEAVTKYPGDPTWKAINLGNFDNFDHQYAEENGENYWDPPRPDWHNDQLLHISLANLTGNPHDSIARPEDCIIDTITA